MTNFVKKLPPCVLPICRKFFEKSVFNVMLKFFIENELISPDQSGFKPGDSCINQVLAITHVITRLIVIDIASLSVLFCNCRLFCNCPLLKDISFNISILVFVDLVWLTKSIRAIFGINHPRDYRKFWNWNFKIFKNTLRQFISNHPPKYVIISTNIQINWRRLWN